MTTKVELLLIINFDIAQLQQSSKRIIFIRLLYKFSYHCFTLKNILDTINNKKNILKRIFDIQNENLSKNIKIDM